MQVGIASLEITPDRLLALQGQMHMRLATHARDPLMATAMAVQDGEQQAVILSCDLCMGPDEFVADLRRESAGRWNIDPRRVLVAATHTHVGPCMGNFPNRAVVDPDYLAQLRAKLVELVSQALANLEPVTLFGGCGNVEHMGWNRRGRHHGIVDMYHGSWRAEFDGCEGPRDGDVPVVFARRADGSIKAVLTSFASHPNCLENNCFYSADFPGELRKNLQQVLGSQVGVVYLTGAAGNTAPSVMENNPKNVQPWRGEEGVVRSGRYLAGEVLKVIAAAVQPMLSQQLALASTTLKVAIRPWNPGFDPATRVQPGPGRDYFLDQKAQWEEHRARHSPASVALHALRLGDAVICTNPGELFVEHGLAIKRGSPARITIISELTDGYCGYLPTRQAFDNGGYETWPAVTSQLDPEAGDTIVAATHQLTRQVFELPS